MLTATEIINLSIELGQGNYKTIDQFLFKRFGFDYWKLPFYEDVKSCLEAMMVRVEKQYQMGTYYEWVDRD